MAARAAADLVGRLQQRDVQAIPREEGRGGEPVGPSTDDDRGRHDANTAGVTPGAERSA